MLETKLGNDIGKVNEVMTENGIPTSDQGRDVMRSVIKGCTNFENTFDRIIQAGKNEK